MTVIVTFRADPLSAGVVRIRARESPRTGTVFSFNSPLEEKGMLTSWRTDRGYTGVTSSLLRKKKNELFKK